MLKTNESRRTAMGAAIVAALVIASVILYLRLGKPMIALVRDPARLRAWVDGLGWKSRIVYGAMVCFQVVVAIIPGEPLELAAGFGLPAMLAVLVFGLYVLLRLLRFSRDSLYIRAFTFYVFALIPQHMLSGSLYDASVFFQYGFCILIAALCRKRRPVPEAETV